MNSRPRGHSVGVLSGDRGDHKWLVRAELCQPTDEYRLELAHEFEVVDRNE